MSQHEDRGSAYAPFEEDHRQFGAPGRRYSAPLRAAVFLVVGTLVIAMLAAIYF